MYGTENIQKLLKMSDLMQNNLQDVKDTINVITGDFDYKDYPPVPGNKKFNPNLEKVIDPAIKSFNKISNKLTNIFEDAPLVKALLNSLPTFADDDATLSMDAYGDYVSVVDLYMKNSPTKINQLDLSKDVQNVFFKYLDDSIKLVPETQDNRDIVYGFLIKTFIA